MIAYITGALPQWSETFIAQELALLRAAGLPLLAIALGRGPGEAEGLGELHYLRPPPADAATTASPSSERATARWPRPLARGRLRRWASLWRHRAERARLVELLRTHGVRHVHAACADLPGLLAATAARELGLGFSLSGHAADVAASKYDDAALFGRAEFICLCNQRARDELLRRQPTLAPRVRLLHHGVRLGAWPFRPRPLSPAGQPLRVLFVGRLTARKRPELALAGVAELARRGTPAHLELIGDGPAGAALELAARALPAGATVTRHGFLPRAAVAAAMATADLLVVTSAELPGGDMEGIPNVVVEAMASGLPVAAGLTGGIPEVVTPATGHPFAPEDPAALAAVVAALRADPAALAARVQAARALIEREFDADALIARKVAWLRATLTDA